MANISMRRVKKQSLRRPKQAPAAEVSVSKGSSPTVHRDLEVLAGTWTALEAREFARATAAFGQVNKDLWRL